MPDFTCKRCASEFHRPPTPGRKPLYCSDACRFPNRRPKPTVCEGCGTPLLGNARRRNPRKWCSDRCRLAFIYKTRPGYRERQAEYAAAKHRATYVPVKHHRTCTICNSSFASKRPNALYCSKPCRYKAAYIGRYARKAGARREKYTRQEIAERDGWCCQICGDYVLASAEYPDDGYPSIDHVIPLAAGGDDTRENVQIAHLRCNFIKGDRLELAA